MPASLIEGWDHAVPRGNSTRDPRDDYGILIARTDQDRTPDLRRPDDWRPKRQLSSKAAWLRHTASRQKGSLLLIEMFKKSVIGKRVHWVGSERSAKAVADTGRQKRKARNDGYAKRRSTGQKYETGGIGHGGGDLSNQATHALPDEYRGVQLAHCRGYVFRVVLKAQAFKLPMIRSWLVMPQPHRVRLVSLRGKIRAELLPDVRTHPDAVNGQYCLRRLEIGCLPVQRPKRTEVDRSHLVYVTERFSVGGLDCRAMIQPWSSMRAGAK